MTDANGIVTEYSYNDAGCVTRIVRKDGSEVLSSAGPVSSKGTSYPAGRSLGVVWFNDILGTTVGAKSGTTYSAAALSAFGERLDKAGGAFPAIRSLGEGWFTGKPAVEGLGHAFLMRNYRAGLAKWQTADPIGYPENAPQELCFGGKPRARRSARRARKGPRWNQLAYCGNGVTGSVDLWGCSGWVLVDSWNNPLSEGTWTELIRAAPSDKEILDILARYSRSGWIKYDQQCGDDQLISGPCVSETEIMTDLTWFKNLTISYVFNRTDTLSVTVTTKDLESDSSLVNAFVDLALVFGSMIKGPKGRLIGIAGVQRLQRRLLMSWLIALTNMGKKQFGRWILVPSSTSEQGKAPSVFSKLGNEELRETAR